jgi:hypothetical protein
LLAKRDSCMHEVLWRVTLSMFIVIQPHLCTLH